VRTAATLTLILALGLTLAACGDSDDDEPATISVVTTPTTTGEATTTTVPPDDSAGTPEAADDPGTDRPRAVEDVVVAVLTGSETAETICDLLVTPDYVQAAYGDRAGCLAAQKPGALAETAEVTEIGKLGTKATAVAIPSGGPYDGVDVQVTLLPAVDLEGAWLVDSLVADVPAGP
jgi:hypothetical protein